MKFKAFTAGSETFGFVEALQTYANEYWLPDHVGEEDAAAIILDAFERKVAGELKLLDLKRER